MAFAKKLERLSAEDLASAARVAPEAGGTDQFFKEAAVPQTVKDVLHTMSSGLCHSGGHGRPRPVLLMVKAPSLPMTLRMVV